MRYKSILITDQFGDKCIVIEDTKKGYYRIFEGTKVIKEAEKLTRYIITTQRKQLFDTKNIPELEKIFNSEKCLCAMIDGFIIA